MEQHQMLLLLFAALLLLVNLGVNIALLVKKKKTSEDYTALVAKSTKLNIPQSGSSNLNPINYKPVARFTQTPGMATEALKFNLAPQGMQANYKACIKFEGLSVPTALVIEPSRYYYIESNTGNLMSRGAINRTLLSSNTSINNFVLTYNNVGGSVTIDLSRVNSNNTTTLIDQFNYTSLNNLGKQLVEYNASVVTVSFGSNYTTAWTLL